MKRFTTQTRFVPLKWNGDGFEHVETHDGRRKEFKARRAVEAYCKKNRCIYCEEKYIFYR